MAANRRRMTHCARRWGRDFGSAKASRAALLHRDQPVARSLALFVAAALVSQQWRGTNWLQTRPRRTTGKFSAHATLDRYMNFGYSWSIELLATIVLEVSTDILGPDPGQSRYSQQRLWMRTCFWDCWSSSLGSFFNAPLLLFVKSSESGRLTMPTSKGSAHTGYQYPYQT